MNFLYEFLLKVVSIARGNILCPAGSVQNNTYQNRKAPFKESGAATSSEADRQRTKGRRYHFIRIVFIIFIILLCLILAVASPLRCFAMSYANEQLYELLISSLASYAITGAAAVLAAETILPICIGICASLTVSTIAYAINLAVECGAWQEYVINVQNNYEYRKEHGSSILNMKAFAFLYAYDWVKEHILGINSNLDTDSSLPTFENFIPMGQTVFPAGSHSMTSDEPYYTQVFNYNNVKYTDYFSVAWANSANRFNHFTDLNYNGRIVRISSPVVPDVKLWADDYCRPKSDIFINHYLPVFEKDKAQLINSFYQFNSSNEKVEYSKVQDCFASPVSFIDINNKIYNIHSIDFNSDTHRITFSYNTRAYGLLLKNNEIITEFDSALDFTYKFFYEATALCKFSVIGSRLELSEKNFIKNSSVPLPVENKKYYDKSKDTIATTAGSVRTKVKDGSITSDTDGKVSVKVNSPAIPAEGSATAVTSNSKINEQVKVTDISTTLEGVQTMNPGDAITIGSNNIQIGAQPMGDKLPFSALKTISNMMNTLFISKTDDNKVKAPVIPVNFKVMNQHIKFDIDFSPLDPYVGLVRIGLSVSFLITTYLCFKKWLVNKEL